MVTTFILRELATGFLIGPLMICNGATCSVDRSEIGAYSGVPRAYGILAEKTLGSLANFDRETWGTMLSDNVMCVFRERTVKRYRNCRAKMRC